MSKSYNSTSVNTWITAFLTDMKTFEEEKIQKYFFKDFFKEEIKTWKYQIEKGNLDFANSIIIQLDKNRILLHVPSNENTYSNTNEEAYFNFIYRIYWVDNLKGKLLISHRCMDEVLPKFNQYTLNIDINIKERNIGFSGIINLKTESPYLILKLAKEFDIKSFKINNKKSKYFKFGYFIGTKVDTSQNIEVTFEGNIKPPETNNQFLSLDDSCFFIRMGGFAVIPSPPPDNQGVCFFSDIETNFDITYSYPKGFNLLHYGKTEGSISKENRINIKSSIKCRWGDELSFYAQNNWKITKINKGKTTINFYFGKNDRQELTYISSKVDSLLNWIDDKFKNNGNFKMNFIVLDNFYKGGLLNDGHSIIAQNAEIIGSDGNGYLHEICHSAPQPRVAGNYLWIKEGFTNYLVFSYLESHGEKNFWRNQKRKYIEKTDLYDSPLINLNYSMPSYKSAYQKGPWIYRMLEFEMGKDKFSKVIVELGKRDKTIINFDEYWEIIENEAKQNLYWFKEQWLFQNGNPTLLIHSEINLVKNSFELKITFKQNKPYFELPLEFDIETSKGIYNELIEIKNEKTVFYKKIQDTIIDISYDPLDKLFLKIEN